MSPRKQPSSSLARGRKWVALLALCALQAASSLAGEPQGQPSGPVEAATQAAGQQPARLPNINIYINKSEIKKLLGKLEFARVWL